MKNLIKIISASVSFTLFFCLLVSFFHFSPADAVYYPIPELGGCSTPGECRFYCEIPKNTPACWSYGKYVMNADRDKNVLGEESGPNLTYPIAELGNCNSANECFLYCAKPLNQQKCLDYAKKHGLIRQETNPKLQKAIEAAKTELGCNSKETCRDFCNQEENHEKCRAFAEKYGLSQNKPEDKAAKTEILEAAKRELGCDSREACVSFCQDELNRAKCQSFAEKYGLGRTQKIKSEISAEATAQAKADVTPVNTPVNCASEEECRQYCSKYPDECPGFNKNFPAATGSGEFLGPGGCKTEAECKAYCIKHPKECPGFPQRNLQPTLLQNFKKSPILTPKAAQ